MSNLYDKWKESVITVYDSQEMSTLELLEDITAFNDEIAQGMDNLDLKIDTEINNLNLQKTDLNGNHLGPWQGLSRPTLSEEGMRATVEKLNNDIPKIENDISTVNSQLEHIVHLSEKTINGIITLANRLKNIGGTILIPDGEYIITDTMLFDGLENITFKGNSNTKLKCLEGTRIVGLKFTNCKNITFENIIFDGNNTITDASQYGNNMLCYANSSTGLKVNNCRFYNCTDVAIQDRTQPFTAEEVQPIDVKIANSVITNCHFENCKMSYITKTGGARNVIYTNNTHYNCMLGFKLDGEAYDMNTSPKQYLYYNTKCGNVIVANNTFNKCGNYDWLNNTNSHCVMIEEHTENVIVSNNVFNKLSYIGAIGVNTGQGCDIVDNVLIIGNIIDDVVESYAITLGHGNIDVQDKGYLGTIKIHSNIFRNIERSAIVSLLQYRYIVELDIKNNTFDSCGNKTSNLSSSLHYECIKINGGAKIVTIDNNTFRPSSTASKKICFAVINHNAFNKYYLRNNLFYGTVGDGSLYADRLIYLQKVRNIIFDNNTFKRCEIRLEETQATFINNYLDGSSIQAYKTNGVDCDIRSFKNIAIKDIEVDYYLRIADDYQFHKSINDIVDSKFTTTNGIMIPSPYTAKVENTL